MKEIIINSWMDIYHEDNDEYGIGVDSYGVLKISKGSHYITTIATQTYYNSDELICEILKLYGFDIKFKKGKVRE